MTMSRKDYVAIAKAIRVVADEAAQTEGTVAPAAVAKITRNVADVFAADNPRFDRGRFIVAALGKDA